MRNSPEEKAAKRDLTSGPLVRNLLRLAGPLAAGAVLSALYNLVDAFWLGKWSKEALASPGVSMPFVFFVISFAMGFGNAGTALVAQYTGAKRYAEADRAAAQTMLILCLLVGTLAAPMIMFAGRILRVFQVPPEMTAQGIIYLRTIMIGLPLLAFNIGYGAILRALGDTVTVVIIGLVSNLVNIALDPLLIFGWRFLPPLGVQGAALATVISQSLSAAACLVLLHRGRAGLRIRAADLKPDWEIIRKTFSVGLPAAIGNSSNSLGFAVFQLMINRLGLTVIAAFTIGFRIIHFFHVPSQSLAMAAVPIVGQALGAGKPRLAKKAVRLSAVIVAIGMLLPVLFLMWQGQFIARLFVPDAATVAETGKFFLIVPASSYMFGVTMVLTAAFLGSGHTKPAMWLAMLRLWGLRLPVGWILGFLVGWGSVGVYTGMVVGNVVTAFATLALFRAGNWQKALVTMPGVEAAEATAATEVAGDRMKEPAEPLDTAE